MRRISLPILIAIVFAFLYGCNLIIYPQTILYEIKNDTEETITIASYREDQLFSEKIRVEAGDVYKQYEVHGISKTTFPLFYNEVDSVILQKEGSVPETRILYCNGKSLQDFSGTDCQYLLETIVNRNNPDWVKDDKKRHEKGKEVIYSLTYTFTEENF